ncbi:Protein UBASH3A-like protein [Diplonema papillatum]|nr:Protein UBASH3A-like protein [Diplonema papillatum]
MNVWFVRHGEREDKQENHHWTGGLDPGLTRAGVGQAQFTGGRLKTEMIDYIYCSPFYRTLLTAIEMAAILGLRVRVENGLSEALLASMYPKQPTLDAKKKAKLQGIAQYVDLQYESDLDFPRWPEDEPDACARCDRTVRGIVDRHMNECSGKPSVNIVVVTHAFAVSSMAGYLTKQKLNIRVESGSLTMVSTAGDRGAFGGKPGDSWRAEWQYELKSDVRHLHARSAHPRLGGSNFSMSNQSNTLLAGTSPALKPAGADFGGSSAIGSLLQTPSQSEVIGVRKVARRRKKASLAELISSNTTDIRRLEFELTTAKTLRSELMKRRVRVNKTRSLFCLLAVEAPAVCKRVVSFLTHEELACFVLSSKILRACIKDISLGSILTSSSATTTLSSSQCTTWVETTETVVSLLEKSPSALLRAKRLFDDDETAELEQATWCAAEQTTGDAVMMILPSGKQRFLPPSTAGDNSTFQPPNNSTIFGEAFPADSITQHDDPLLQQSHTTPILSPSRVISPASGDPLSRGAVLPPSARSCDLAPAQACTPQMPGKAPHLFPSTSSSAHTTSSSASACVSSPSRHTLHSKDRSQHSHHTHRRGLVPEQSRRRVLMDISDDFSDIKTNASSGHNDSCNLATIRKVVAGTAGMSPYTAASPTGGSPASLNAGSRAHTIEAIVCADNQRASKRHNSHASRRWSPSGSEPLNPF